MFGFDSIVVSPLRPLCNLLPAVQFSDTFVSMPRIMLPYATRKAVIHIAQIMSECVSVNWAQHRDRIRRILPSSSARTRESISGGRACDTPTRLHAMLLQGLQFQATQSEMYSRKVSLSSRPSNAIRTHVLYNN